MSYLVKLLPLLQMLWEVFKPGEGEKISRAGKMLTLAFIGLFGYSAFVSLAYIEQYHALVQIRESSKYVNQRVAELKVRVDQLTQSLDAAYLRLSRCPPDTSYDSSPRQAKMPPQVERESPILNKKPNVLGNTNDKLRNEVMDILNGQEQL